MVDLENTVLFNNDLGPRDRFIKLDWHYHANDIYKHYMAEMGQSLPSDEKRHWEKIVRPIMECTNRTIEFYVSKVAKNMKVNSQNQAVTDAINQFYKMSNWEIQQDLAKRFLALHGNLFVKVIGTKTKVYTEIIHAKDVTKIKVDNRGYLTEIRIDVDMVDEDGQSLLYTEWWFKDSQSYYIFQSKSNSRVTKLNEMVDLIDAGSLSDYGIDFIPFVFARFKDTGRPDNLGDGALDHVLDQLDFANVAANRMADNILKFNKPLTVITGTDQDETGQLNAPITTDLYKQDDYAVVNADSFDLKNVQSGVNHDADINLANFIKTELEENLPELRFYKIKESDSGASVRLTMAGAISKAESMQKAFLAAVSQMDSMAITIGQFYGLWSVGSYDNGDFEHEISCDDVFPLTISEKFTLLNEMKLQLDQTVAMKLLGFSDDIIKEQADKKAIADQKTLEQQQTQFATVFNGQ